MKFLIDEYLSPELAKIALEKGYGASPCSLISGSIVWL